MPFVKKFRRVDGGQRCHRTAEHRHEGRCDALQLVKQLYGRKITVNASTNFHTSPPKTLYQSRRAVHSVSSSPTLSSSRLFVSGESVSFDKIRFSLQQQMLSFHSTSRLGFPFCDSHRGTVEITRRISNLLDSLASILSWPNGTGRTSGQPGKIFYRDQPKK